MKMRYHGSIQCVFFFNDTATTEIYTLSLHDALPILVPCSKVVTDKAAAGRLRLMYHDRLLGGTGRPCGHRTGADRKSTRLNSSHANISYAVFCLKKKPNIYILHPLPLA